MIETVYYSLVHVLGSAAHSRYILFLLTWEQARDVMCDVKASPIWTYSDQEMVIFAVRRFAAIAMEEVGKRDTLVSVTLVDSF